MGWRPVLMMIGGLWVVCVVVGYCEKPSESAIQIHASTEDDFLRRFASLAASFELAKIHSRKLDTEVGMGKVWNRLFDQLLITTDVDASWKGRIVPPSYVPTELAREIGYEKVDRKRLDGTVDWRRSAYGSRIRYSASHC